VGERERERERERKDKVTQLNVSVSRTQQLVKKLARFISEKLFEAFPKHDNLFYLFRDFRGGRAI
jgi:hypothetical protein